MGWVCTDNESSLSLSASKFIILSDSAAPNPLTQKTESNPVVWALPHDPRGWRLHPLQTELHLSLSSLPPTLARSPKGWLQCVINFTFPVCRRGERRLCPSSGPACPRGHQLKTLIGQQYIKVAPGSESSQSARNPLVGLLFQTQKYRKKHAHTSTRAGVGRVLCRVGFSVSALAGSLSLSSLFPARHIKRSFPLLCSEFTSLTSPKSAA